MLWKRSCDSCASYVVFHVFGNMRGKVHLMFSDLDDAERDVLGASALAWEVPEYSLFK